MKAESRDDELHKGHRVGWLRAAVLGANDGIVSTASLVIGVAAAGTTRSNVVVAGVAGLVAGAMSMAAGEYVSVSSQADTERADLERERRELEEDEEAETQELADIYLRRGLDRELADRVARQLMAHDALGAHARDELGLTPNNEARPLQAALASAAAFGAGAAMPLATLGATPMNRVIPVVAIVSLVSLAVLGALGAKVGGAPIVKASLRVMGWGTLAMGFTALIGLMFDVGGV